MTAAPTPLSLERATQMLWRRKWPALALFAVVLTTLSSIALFLPSLYSASATILVEGQQVPERFIGPGVTGELERRLQTMNQALLSRSKVSEMLQRFRLYEDLGDEMSDQARVELFRRSLSVRFADAFGRTSSGAFTITFRGNDPNKVAVVANEIASMFIDEDLRRRERVASDTTEFMEARLDEYRKKLETQEEALRKFKEDHLEELPSQESGQLQEVEGLREQLLANRDRLARAREERAMLKAELERLQDPLPETADVNVRISQLHRRYERVSEASRGLDALSAEIRGLEKDGERLELAIAEAETRLQGIPRRVQELTALQRDYATTQELYTGLLRSYEQAKLTETLEQRQKGEQFRLIEPAVVPDQPSAPNRMRFFLLAPFAALAAAGLAVVLLEQLDTSFHTVDELRAFARVPVLAAVPRMSTAALKRRQQARLAFGSLSLAVGLPAIVASIYLVTHDNQWLVVFFS